MNKENHSYSYVICNKMIDDVFKKHKENILKERINIMEKCIKVKQIVFVSGSGYKAAKFLR